MKKIYQRAMAVALAGTTLLGAGLWHQHHRISPAPSKQATKNADALPTGVSEATMADIRSSLEKQEYHISFDEQKKKLQSPNRRNNIRAYYEPGKLTVQTRVDTTGEGFKVELLNEGVFADGKLLYAPELTAKAMHHENKVQISHSAFTEEFINNEDGVRQNFIIENAPEGTREVQVKMNAKGLKVEQSSGNELRFYSEAADGQIRNELVYSDLKCWDADKKPLNATLAYVDNRIQISVDVAGAAYPVTIDPIITNGTPQNANKVIQVDQSYMHLGFSVSSAGDVNGDGYSDVIVGAPDYDYTKDAEGGAFVYQGHPSGLTLTAVVFKSNQIGAKMGYSVSSAGDFNGDGYGDVVVGAAFSNLGELEEGAAYIFHGTPGGIMTAGKVLQSNKIGAHFGASVSTAGDVNGDGFGDLIIGAPDYYNGLGAAILYYGANSGVSEVSPVPTVLDINSPYTQFGWSVGSAGDVNGDGYADVVIGAKAFENQQSDEGKVFVYHGAPGGIKPTAAFSTESNQDNAQLGFAVSGAGDVNGDGYSDIIVGAPHANYNQATDVGSATVYYGNNGKGLKNNVRLFNGDLVTPLNHSQFSQNNFIGTLSTKSFTGRNKGKFVWETMGPGVPFSKVGNNPITTSNQFTSTSGFTGLTGLATILGGSIAKTGISTKLRVRVRYSPVLAITGQMYGPWRYLQSQLAGFNNAPVPEEAMAETIKKKTSYIVGDESRLSIVPYPNPVSDKLFIKAENTAHIRSVRFFTPNGKLIYQSQNEAEVDVRNLDPGMYVLLVTLRDGTQSSHKVIVKK